MKKSLILAAALVFLTGCSHDAQTFETLSDTYVQPVMAAMQQAVVSLPSEASVTVLESETAGSIYLCDGYTITMHTTAAGDLDETLRTATGFGKEELNLVQTESDGVKRIQSVWTAAGEGEDQVGRLAVLDDGSYHYVLTCMANASKVPELQPVWQDLFDSFRLISPDVELHTGS